MPGFQGKDWWAVGSMDADDEKSRGGDDDGGGDGGSSSPRDGDDRGGSSSREPAGVSMGGDQGSMAYWSDGSAALVVTSAVRRTGLTADDLYGDGRMKFLPAALLNLAGPRAVPPYLTGEMPGDVGWDPLQMGAQRDIVKLRERELIHGRWAMLAAIGVLVPECTAKLSIFGSPGQHWWNTAVTWPEGAPIPELTYLGETIPWGVAWLPIIHLPLFLIAELLRAKYKLEAFEDLDRMYPGEALRSARYRQVRRRRGSEHPQDDRDSALQVGDDRVLRVHRRGCGWGAGPLDFLP